MAAIRPAHETIPLRDHKRNARRYTSIKDGGMARPAMSLLARYRRLNFWGKFSVWGSISSIIPFGLWICSFFRPAPPASVASQPAPSSVVTSSPGAATMQAGRDIVINNPLAAKVEAIPPRREAPAVKPPAPIQTMINSPGSIQAGGNVTVTSDRRVINSMMLRIVIETETSPTPPGEAGTDVGLQSIVALFTKDKARIRFATDFKLQDHQTSETRRRLTFSYTPEDPEELFGKPVDFLSSMDVLGVNFAEILKIKKIDASSGNSQLDCSVFVNGIPVTALTAVLNPGILSLGPANIRVSEAFSKLPAAYDAAVSKR